MTKKIATLKFTAVALAAALGAATVFGSGAANAEPRHGGGASLTIQVGGWDGNHRNPSVRGNPHNRHGWHGNHGWNNPGWHRPGQWAPNPGWGYHAPRPFHQARRELRRMNFRHIHLVNRRGNVYVVRARNAWGHPVRIRMNAYTLQILNVRYV